MIIQCPACTTRYVVPDSAIGVEGRTVRCAKCRHNWFQDGPELDLADQASQAEPIADDPPAAASPAEETRPPEQPQPAPPPETVSAPEPEPEPAPEPEPEPQEDDDPVGPSFIKSDADYNDDYAEPEVSKPPSSDPAPSDPPLPDPPLVEGPSPESLRDDIRPARSQPVDYGDPPASTFDPEPPFRPRRNPLKVWTWAAGIFAIVAAGLIFAVSYWGLPDWVPVDKPTFAVAEPDLQLDFPREQQERRTLPNGTEFFGASGTITNIGTTTRTIPTILIVLRDSRDRIVYSWEVSPRQRTIAPGETLPVNEAVTDIPRAARAVQFGWKPE